MNDLSEEYLDNPDKKIEGILLIVSKHIHFIKKIKLDEHNIRLF